jgi:hypothetical protein
MLNKLKSLEVMKINMSCPVKKIEDAPAKIAQTVLKRRSSIQEFSAFL